MSPSIQYFEKPALKNRINIAFSTVKFEGVIEIFLIEAKRGKTYKIREDNQWIEDSISLEEEKYLQWANKEENKGEIFMSELFILKNSLEKPKLLMKMAIPLWEISVDESHPIPTNKFAGAIIFTVDVTYLVSKVTKKIKSGKRGYAWVIDHTGIFIYHEERSFIGQNAFEARKGRKPTISFARINEIQREKMLKDKEGTSWYISGWHRGVEGEIKKLIAYAPIKLKEKPQPIVWSIAVVAPISEVEGAIYTVQVQQMVLQGIIIAIILLGGLFINFILVTWSNILEREVTKKTNELQK